MVTLLQPFASVLGLKWSSLLTFDQKSLGCAGRVRTPQCEPVSVVYYIIQWCKHTHTFFLSLLPFPFTLKLYNSNASRVQLVKVIFPTSKSFSQTETLYSKVETVCRIVFFFFCVDAPWKETHCNYV